MSGEQETPESNIIEKQVRILPHPNRIADQQGLQASAVNSPCLRDVLGLSLKIKRRLATSLGEDCWAAADDSMEFESPPRDYTR